MIRGFKGKTMSPSRRGFLAQSALLMSGLASPSLPSSASSPSHVVLLGDSIFDNGRYTAGKPAVIQQLRAALPNGWKASLLAADGATTDNVPSQLARLPRDADRLVLSIGGNDALRQAIILDMPVKSSAQALLALADVARDFEASYRRVVEACLKRGRPLIACTIYNGNFAEASYKRRAAIALATFNDAIIRVATERRITVIELRQICQKAEDFANAIEPSVIGGEKIARAIARTVTTETANLGAARIVGAV
jgi:hypothetical protein